jgi:2-dehydro-3-deoxy-D-gluconate 5-dehydrogenase
MILDKFKLDGKTALVTGASKGLGYAMAVALAEAGADIANACIGDGEELGRAVKAVGRKFLHIKADLTSQSIIPEIIDKTVKSLGDIDILVNNAGIIRRAPITEFTEKDWDDVINVNLKSLFYLSQAVVKNMLKNGRGGKIINVASLLSFQGGIRVPSYTAAKSGVMGLTKLMANELAQHNINVNAIAPGYMATDNTTALREDPKRSAEILSRIPAGRWGMPEDLMGIVVFLASDASAYVNGYTIAVDGGWLAR